MALALTSPVPRAPPPPACRWYDRYAHRCRDEDIEYLGEWDPRPGPEDWSSGYYPTPPAWGAFPTEKPRASSSYCE
jgi:hypothetical protein